MARARLIKPDFFDDEAMCSLPLGARLLFVSLWTQADRDGRLENRPAKFAAFAFPAMGNEALQAKSRKEVQCWLDSLVEAGCVVRYEVNGRSYLHIPSWTDHQKVHKNEPQSTLPAPPNTESQPMAERVQPLETTLLSEKQSVAGSGSGNKAEAEAKAEAGIGGGKAAAPEAPPSFPFALTYAKRYQQSHAGRPPPQTEHAAALALEREYGSDACLQLGQDLDWQKHPNYMRPILEERRNGRPKLQAVGNAAGRGSGGPDDVAGAWQQYADERRALQS